MFATAKSAPEPSPPVSSTGSATTNWPPRSPGWGRNWRQEKRAWSSSPRRPTAGACGAASGDARNLAEWLSWLTGMSPKSSRDHALVAAKLEKLPETHAALAGGSISFDQARLIASAGAPEHDAKLTELARQTTTGQLQRVVGAYRKVTALSETGDANAAHERRYLNYYFLDDCFELHGRLTTEDGAVVAKALDRARDRLFRAAGNREAVPWESHPSYVCADQLRADALVEVAESWLDEHKSGRANSYEVVVHVDADALRSDAAGARCEIEGAGAIAPETARRLL